MTIKLSTNGKPLPAGGCIGVIATGAPLAPDRLRAGIEVLERLGYQVKCPLDPSTAYGSKDSFTVAPAAERIRALYELLQDRSVHAILASRGAYGALDILPRLDMEQLRASGKLLIGCSDVTVLLTQAPFRAGIPSIHGATLGSSVADYEKDPAARESVDMLLSMLRDPEFRVEQRIEPLRDGSGRGPILAGNLTMLLTLLGTPWDVDYSGTILVVEDVGEAPYRIHRALMQLKLAGKLERLAGFAFGRFAKCDAPNGPSLEEVMSMAVRDIFPAAPYPVVRGLEAGHWGKNVPLPMGCTAEITGGVFRTLQSPLRAS